MIFLLSKSSYNGDALARLRVEPGDSAIHQYYTVGMRANLDLADVIREYNVVRCTVVHSVIYLSGNAQDWIWLVRLLRESLDPTKQTISDYIVAAIPDVFRNPSALMKR